MAVLTSMPEYYSASSLISIYLPVALLVTLGYFLHLIAFDPLRKYPGPLLARLSNLWRVYHFWRADLPIKLFELHRKYGPVVRVGPNDLDFDSAAAIKSIYKAGKSMPKTDFYQGFTAIQPNLFGTQDEAVSREMCPAKELWRTDGRGLFLVTFPTKTTDGSCFLCSFS